MLASRSKIRRSSLLTADSKADTEAVLELIGQGKTLKESNPSAKDQRFIGKASWRHC